MATPDPEKDRSKSAAPPGPTPEGHVPHKDGDVAAHGASRVVAKIEMLHRLHGVEKLPEPSPPLRFGLRRLPHFSLGNLLALVLIQGAALTVLRRSGFHGVIFALAGFVPLLCAVCAGYIAARLCDQRGDLGWGPRTAFGVVLEIVGAAAGVLVLLSPLLGLPVFLLLLLPLAVIALSIAVSLRR